MQRVLLLTRPPMPVLHSIPYVVRHCERSKKGLPPVFGRNPLQKSGAKRTLFGYLVPSGERQGWVVSDRASRRLAERTQHVLVNGSRNLVV